MKFLLLSKDNNVIDAVRAYAGQTGHDVSYFNDLFEARDRIVDGSYDAVLLDCSIRPTDLIDFTVSLDDALSELVVLLIGPLDIEQRELLSRRVSAHYSIEKPLRGKAFYDTMQRVVKRATIVKAGLFGRSPRMEETIQTIIQIGSTPINVLITGESGTGKEVVARALHAVSARSDKPFLAVNCAALAEGVLESELFGHEKGAFTGAVSRRIGMFERANSGTIFLDEIGEIPHSTQIRLLRVLEEKEIIRVGGTDVIQVDVRVIAATNRNLDELVREGGFRRDLYYRIKVFVIAVPPLRERPEDIPLLIDRIARQYALDNTLPVRRLSEDAKRMLSQAPWIGNVRELRNLVESCLALTSASSVDLKDIPSNLLNEISPHTTLPVKSTFRNENAERELIFRTLLELKNDVEEIKRILLDKRFSSHDSELSRMVEVVPIDPQRDQTLEDMEHHAIIDALAQTDGNRRKAAKLLGIGERTLYRKLKQYGIS